MTWLLNFNFFINFVSIENIRRENYYVLPEYHKCVLPLLT